MKRRQRGPRPDAPPEFILGLDLGQTKDFTALVVLQRRWQALADQPGQEESLYWLQHLERWPLQTSYPKIVTEVSDLVARPPLRGEQRPVLVVDQTGVGRAVVDLFRQAQQGGKLAAELRPTVITFGHEILAGEDGALHVPKKELVGAVQVLLQAQRLKFASVPMREVLLKELLTFKVKVTAAANETFEAWRERDHDDLVLAVALASWQAERGAGLATDWPAAVEEPPRYFMGRQVGRLPELFRRRRERGE
jgi:hypothetical protein